jgi:hypothetical protein
LPGGHETRHTRGHQVCLVYLRPAQIARTFHDAGLPDGFHRAAAKIYGAVIRDEEAASMPGVLDEVIEALRR